MFQTSKRTQNYLILRGLKRDLYSDKETTKQQPCLSYTLIEQLKQNACLNRYTLRSNANRTIFKAEVTVNITLWTDS